MNLENIMLGKVKHKRLNIIEFHLQKISRMGKSIDTERILKDAKGSVERGMRNSSSMGTGFSFEVMKMFWS